MSKPSLSMFTRRILRIIRIQKRRKIRVYKIVHTKKQRERYLEQKEAARALVHARLLHFNIFYTFTYGRVSIKDLKSRWGSCSSRGNLNFNYRIGTLRPALADYIVVHELCHRGEFNHSEKFWNLVAKTIPNYIELRKELKEIRIG